MRRPWIGPLLAALVACAPVAGSGGLPRPGDSVPQLDLGIRDDRDRVHAIVREATERSTALRDLEHLTTVIGPRLTGSEGLRRATTWMAERLRAHGADSVWLEEFTVAAGWERGAFALRLLSPHQRVLQGASAGWAPGTEGASAGNLVYVDARTLDDFQARFRGKLRGAWVVTRLPLPMFDPFRASAADSARVRAGREALYAPPRTPDEEAFLAMRDSVLAAEEIAGTIASSDKDRGLLSMFGGPSRGTRRPAIIVSHDTFSELHRFLARGEPVRIEARIENRFTPALIAHNVVAELRGASKPGEIVLLGAHLDSWDLATGATDNGAGVVAVADALRAVAKGARPARTFRVALFAGEEQGLLGSTAYVTRHAAELAHHQAVLVVDNGSGRISGVTLQGWEELRAAWERLLAPLTAVGPLSIEPRTRTGSDHLPFLRAGVPAYLFNQEWRSYDWTWHTQADGYDQVVPDELPQIGAVLAAVGWGLANAERLIPRRAP